MILALPPAPAPASHDSVPARAAVPCRGETITRLEVRRFAPGGRRLHAGADTAVILAYVRLAPGRRCLERDRADSERMLRAQRFLASAAVIPVPDGAGRVAIRVDVVDEVPWVVGARLRGTQVQSLRVGSLDFGGAGRMIVGTVSRGGAYRWVPDSRSSSPASSAAPPSSRRAQSVHPSAAGRASRSCSRSS